MAPDLDSRSRSGGARIAILALFLCSCPPVGATDEIRPAFRDAPAVELEDIRSWEIIPARSADYSVRRRIAILSPEGLSHANQVIVYDAETSRVSGFRAWTERPDGERVDVPSSLIHDKVHIKTGDTEDRRIQFTFPGAEPGVVIGWEYTIREKEPSWRRRWVVQSDIPLVRGVFSASIKQPPAYEQLYLRAASRVALEPGCTISDSHDGARKSRLEVRCGDVPAYEPETSAPPERDSLLAIDWMWGSAGLVPRIWESWTTAQSRRIGAFLRDVDALDRVLAEIDLDVDAESESESERVDRIQAHVKRSFTFRDDLWSRGATPNLEQATVGEVVSSRGGLPDEIALLTLGLLRRSGIAARSLAVSDRRHGRFVYETLDVPSHLVLEINVDGGSRILDASCRYCPYGTIDWIYSSNGASGIRLQPGGGQISVPPAPIASNFEERVERRELGEDGSVTVAGTVTWGGQFAIERRRHWTDSGQAERERSLFGERRDTIEQPMLLASDLTDLLVDPTATYSYSTSESNRVDDGRWLLQPDVEFTELVPVPIQTRRVQPIWVPFGYVVNVRSRFVLPPGHERTGLLPVPGKPIEGPGMRFRQRWAPGDSLREIEWVASLSVQQSDIAIGDYEAARRFALSVRRALRDGIVVSTGATESDR